MSRTKLQYVDEILGRLRSYLQVETDAALAESLGLSRSAISVWKMRGSLDIALVLTKCSGINLHWLITGEGNPQAPSTDSVVTTGELELLRQLKDYGVDVAEIMSLMLEVALLAEQKGFVLDWEQTPLTLSMRKLKPSEKNKGMRLGMPLEDDDGPELKK